MGINDDLERVARKRRWTAADGALVLAAFSRSGLSQRKFGERWQLDHHRLSRWKGRLAREPRTAKRVPRRRPPEAHDGVTFVPAVPRRDESAAWLTLPAVSIALTGAELRVDVHDAASSPAPWLADLIRALRDQRP